MTEWDLAEARRSRASRVIDVREQASCAAGTGARCLPSPTLIRGPAVSTDGEVCGKPPSNMFNSALAY